MKRIKIEALRRMNDVEGLIIQGCGGNLAEWVTGINEILTKEDILLDGETFKNISAFEHDGLTNLLFNIDNVKLNIGKLAMWRLQTHKIFGGTWLSDYVPNRLGGFVSEQQQKHEDAVKNEERIQHSDSDDITDSNNEEEDFDRHKEYNMEDLT